jgi:hypothetical protein
MAKGQCELIRRGLLAIGHMNAGRSADPR